MLLEKIKNNKLYIGIALVIQGLSFVIASLISLKKRREESGTLLAVAAILGAIGAYLVATEMINDDDIYSDLDSDFDDFDFDADSFDIYGNEIEHDITDTQNDNFKITDAEE